jgi:hypothetical protein
MKINDDEFDSEQDMDGDSIISETSKESLTDSSLLSNNLLIKAISKTLTLILEENKKLNDYNQIIILQSKMVFSAHSIPKISLFDYLSRIQTYSYIEAPTLICSLIYVDRICDMGGITLTYYNIHRILFAAILTSIKYNEDVFYDNNYYAQVAGVRSKELNMIEYSFLELMEFKLFILEEDYLKYRNYLESCLESKE